VLKFCLTIFYFLFEGNLTANLNIQINFFEKREKVKEKWIKVHKLNSIVYLI